MKIEGEALYKIVEFDKGIIILNALDTMPGRPEAVGLIAGKPSVIGEYLVRYMHARGEGKNIREAHKQALGKDALVLRKGDLDE